MQEYVGARLSILLGRLRELEQKLSPMKIGGLNGEGAEVAVRELLTALAQECDKLSLPASFAQIMVERLDAGVPLPALARDFKLLHETIERDSEKRLFLMLSPEEAEQYRNPTSGFSKTIAAFRRTEDDIKAARRCFVLGQDTACVFHCMGILQRGLFALADNLDVKFKGSIELENWGTIIDRIEKVIGDSLIDGIEKAIKRKRETLPKGNDKDDQLKFYSAVATRFAYFKDAWRNHVCHLREQYDHDQAFLVLTSVKDFMEILSSHLKEAET